MIIKFEYGWYFYKLKDRTILANQMGMYLIFIVCVLALSIDLVCFEIDGYIVPIINNML